LAKGIIPPSDNDNAGASTRSGSTERIFPIPLQLGHAPWGELNENERGSISGMEILHTGQENFSEYM
jgi:hypothetical protein